MRLFALATACALAACSQPDSNVSNGEEFAEEAGPAAAENDIAMSEPIAQEPVAGPGNMQGPQPPEEDGDQCGASAYQYLVGQPRSRIPAEPEGATWRVTCTGCPVTMDYNPERMNIFYDEETETVEEVRCG